MIKKENEKFQNIKNRGVTTSILELKTLLNFILGNANECEL